jgi:hypothetical protein
LLLLTPQRLVEPTQRSVELRVDFGTPLLSGLCAGAGPFRRSTAVAALTFSTALAA